MVLCKVGEGPRRQVLRLSLSVAMFPIVDAIKLAACDAQDFEYPSVHYV